jgi:3-hydroxybutyryl-CoA dehydrogenase
VDLAGLVTFGAVAASLYPELSAATAPTPALTERIERGATGARAGRGFYEYPPGAHESLMRDRDTRLLLLRRLLGGPTER